MIDNDENGYVDCDDFACSRNDSVTVCGDSGNSGNGNPENTDALCGDMMDNDGDGFTDCDDFDCSRTEAVTVCQ